MVDRVCVSYLLLVPSLVQSVLLQECKGKPAVATREKDEPWAPVVSVATGTLCKGKPPVATLKKDEPWAPVVSVATGTLPYTEYDPPPILSTLKVIWSGSDSPRAGLLGLL